MFIGNEKGFSVMGAMIGAAITSLVVLAMSQMMASTAATHKYMTDINDATASEHIVSLSLTQPQNCMETFVNGGGPIAMPAFGETVAGPEEYFVIDASSNPVSILRNSSQINQTLELEYSELYGALPPSPPNTAGEYTQVVELNLIYKRNVAGHTHLARKFPLVIARDSANNIISCSTSPTATTDPSTLLAAAGMCADGEVVQGFDSEGALVCGESSSSTTTIAGMDPCSSPTALHGAIGGPIDDGCIAVQHFGTSQCLNGTWTVLTPTVCVGE